MEKQKNKNTQVQGQVQDVVFNKGPDYRTSDGYFRDPITGTPLTGSEPRCNDGLRTPRILASDGKTHIPLAYKFWTKEERDHFKSSKGTGTSRSGSSPKSSVKEDELRTVCDEVLGIVEKSLKGKDLETVKGLISKIRPKDVEVQRVEKLVSGLSQEQVELLKSLLK